MICKPTAQIRIEKTDKAYKKRLGEILSRFLNPLQTEMCGVHGNGIYYANI